MHGCVIENGVAMATCAAGLTFTVSLCKLFHHPFNLLPLSTQLEASQERSQCCDKIKAMEHVHANKLVKHLSVLSTYTERK